MRRLLSIFMIFFIVTTAGATTFSKIDPVSYEDPQITVTGPNKVLVDHPANFTVAIELYVPPDEANWSFILDWYDGTDTGWIGPYEPGMQVNETFTHFWSQEDRYPFFVKIKTEQGFETDWILVFVVRVFEEDNFQIISPGHPGLYKIRSEFFYSRRHKSFWTLADWSDKPFPHDTYMYFGRLTAYEFEAKMAFKSHLLLDVDVYLDDEWYTTLDPVPFPPESLDPAFYLYYFSCSEEGFHNVHFVPEGELEQLPIEVDIQLGFKGFRENILPYLL